MNEPWHTHEWVMAHIWMSHGTHMNESWHTYEWVMAHIWMSGTTHMNGSCHTCKCAMAHIRMNHGTHTNESWHTYEWVMAHLDAHKTAVILIRHVDQPLCFLDPRIPHHLAHIWMSHECVVCMNESWITYEFGRVMDHILRTSHGWHMNVSRVQTSHGSHMSADESWITYECLFSIHGFKPNWITYECGRVIGHIWMCHVCERVMDHIWTRTSHGSHMNVSSRSTDSTPPGTHVNE